MYFKPKINSTKKNKVVHPHSREAAKISRKSHHDVRVQKLVFLMLIQYIGCMMLILQKSSDHAQRCTVCFVLQEAERKSPKG